MVLELFSYRKVDRCSSLCGLAYVYARALEALGRVAVGCWLLECVIWIFSFVHFLEMYVAKPARGARVALK